MDTTENNKLIAEFMGFEKTKSGNLYIMPEGYEWERFLDVENYILPEQFLFHTSWDWLMSIVEKIEGLVSKFTIRIYTLANTYTDVTIDDIVNIELATSKIEAVYNAVIAFINWYNQQQK